MHKGFLSGFLSSGFRPDPTRFQDLEKFSRIRFLNLLALIGLLLTLYLLVMYQVFPARFNKDLPLIYGIPALVTVLTVYLRRSHNTRATARCYLIAFLLVFSYSMLSGSGMFLLIGFPLFSVYMLGTRHGLYWSLAMFACLSLVTAAVGLGYLRATHSLDMLTRVLVAYAAVTAMSHFVQQHSQRNTSIFLQHLSTDKLTGLHNRDRLMNDLHKNGDRTLALVDIDNFRGITTFYGHRIGDAILVNLTDTLLEALAHSPHRLYKLHADEFALLMAPGTDRTRAESLAEHLYHTIEQTDLSVQDNPIKVTATIGIGSGPGNVLEKADMALKYAKQHHKNLMYFDESLHLSKEYENNLHWTAAVREAIRENRIRPFFQPLINNRNGAIEKYEALLRMINQRGDWLVPGLFLGVAKHTKLYPALTRIMVERTLEMIRGSEYDFSLNLSAEDIMNPDTVDFIKGLVIASGAGERLIFEIIESESIENYEEISRFINNMKDLGCRIAIDDFGSGYSNFNHILRLNVDIIKIDGDLIKNLDNDGISRAIVENIVTITKKLDITTVAEFVHSRAVLQAVKELEIDYSQGFYLGEPQEVVLF